MNGLCYFDRKGWGNQWCSYLLKQQRSFKMLLCDDNHTLAHLEEIYPHQVRRKIMHFFVSSDIRCLTVLYGLLSVEIFEEVTQRGLLSKDWIRRWPTITAESALWVQRVNRARLLEFSRQCLRHHYYYYGCGIGNSTKVFEWTASILRVCAHNKKAPTTHHSYDLFIAKSPIEVVFVSNIRQWRKMVVNFLDVYRTF